MAHPKLDLAYAGTVSISASSWHPIVGWRRRLQSCSCLSKWYCRQRKWSLQTGFVQTISYWFRRTENLARVAEMCKRFLQCQGHQALNRGVPICTNLNNSLNVWMLLNFFLILLPNRDHITGITQDAAAIAEMCQRNKTSFILDGITSVGSLPVHPQERNAEAVVMGFCVYLMDPQNCSNSNQLTIH